MPTVPALLGIAIANIVQSLDHSLGDDLSQPAQLLYFECDAEGFNLGLKQLPHGVHPLEDLLGFVAPESWHALGTVAHGWGTDLTSRRRERVRTIFVLDRDGGEHSAIRRRGETLRVIDEPAAGMVPDAIRRALGLATAPPTTPAAELVAAQWIDGLLDVKPQPGRRWLTIDDVTATRPDPHRAWEDVRWEVVRGERRLPDLSATTAAWMDEGMFARWVASSYAPLDHLLGRLDRVADGPAVRDVRRTLSEWGIDSQRR